jgi:hypothetical protein
MIFVPAMGIALAAGVTSVFVAPLSAAENPPPPVRDMVRLARGELEIARLRALQRFDRSSAGKALVEQVQSWGAKLTAAIAERDEADQVAAAAALQSAQGALDSARQAAVDADPAVRAASAKVEEPRTK